MKSTPAELGSNTRSEANSLSVESPFPRLALVVPPLVPASILAAMAVADLAGAELNIHGGAGVLLLFVVFGAVAALIFEAFLVPAAFKRLSRHSELRTIPNIACLVVAIACCLVGLVWLLGGFLK